MESFETKVYVDTICGETKIYCSKILDIVKSLVIELTHL